MTNLKPQVITQASSLEAGLAERISWEKLLDAKTVSMMRKPWPIFTAQWGSAQEFPTQARELIELSDWERMLLTDPERLQCIEFMAGDEVTESLRLRPEAKRQYVIFLLNPMREPSFTSVTERLHALCRDGSLPASSRLKILVMLHLSFFPLSVNFLYANFHICDSDSLLFNWRAMGGEWYEAVPVEAFFHFAPHELLEQMGIPHRYGEIDDEKN